MGLFDIFKSKSEGKTGQSPKKGEREIARLTKLVSTKLSQNYDRQEAIEELGRIATAESAAALLRRFDWTMEPSITDQEEKESAVRGVVAAGEEALEPIRDYCRKAESLTWPLRTLKEIVPPDHFQEELLAVLDLFDTEYVRNPEPKIQLINMLEEFHTEDVRIAVEPFVTDASEPVRFAAVTTLFAVGMSDSVPALIAGLEQEESLRVRNRIAERLAERKWEVPEEVREACAKTLPPGFSLDGAIVKRR